MKKILLVLLTLCGSASAQNLGIFGPTYKIAEVDAFEWIVNVRLPELQQSGEIDNMHKKLQDKSKFKVENPKGTHLPAATKVKVRRQSLIYTLTRDVFDAKGRMLFNKGKTANPADILPESKKVLLFIDGSSLNQVKFAIQEHKQNNFLKIVLVTGKPLELMREHGLTFYFDQHQRLIDRFQIKALPAKVYRQKSELVIEEVVL